MDWSRLLQKVGYGQILSLILAATGIINDYIGQVYHINVPVIQALSCYALLAATCLLYSLFSGQLQKSCHQVRRHLWLFIAVGAADFAANYFIVRAFEALYLPEVMIFSSLSTPISMIINALWVKPRPKYHWMQYFGIILCIASTVYYGADNLTSFSATKTKLYCVLQALLSALFYAISNNLQEYSSKNVDSADFLSGLGLSGSLFAVIVLVSSHLDEIPMITGASRGLWLILPAYAVILSSFYLLIPFFLTRYSAVDFNLSLLTSNFFGIIAGVLIFDNNYSSKVYTSIFLINVGLLIYNLAPQPSIPVKQEST